MASFVMPALKIGGMALGMGAFGKKQASTIGQPSAAETAATTATTNQAQTLSGQGSQLFKLAFPQLQQAGGYFKSLLSGSRGAMGSAVQPEMSAISDLYRGAGQNLERSGIQGAAKDVATADLGRERAGKIAGLIPGLRSGAATSLAGLAGGEAGAGMNATSQAGGLYQDLTRNATQSRMWAEKLKSEQSQGLGKLFFDLLKAFPGFFGGSSSGGGGGMPGTPIGIPAGPGG